VKIFSAIKYPEAFARQAGNFTFVAHHPSSAKRVKVAVKRNLIGRENTIGRSVGTDRCSGIEQPPVHARQVIDHADPTDKSFVV
jgi:hypothetical protein